MQRWLQPGMGLAIVAALAVLAVAALTRLL